MVVAVAQISATECPANAHPVDASTFQSRFEVHGGCTCADLNTCNQAHGFALHLKASQFCGMATGKKHAGSALKGLGLFVVLFIGAQAAQVAAVEHRVRGQLATRFAKRLIPHRSIIYTCVVLPQAQKQLKKYEIGWQLVHFVGIVHKFQQTGSEVGCLVGFGFCIQECQRLKRSN